MSEAPAARADSEAPAEQANLAETEAPAERALALVGAAQAAQAAEAVIPEEVQAAAAARPTASLRVDATTLLKETAIPAARKVLEGRAARPQATAALMAQTALLATPPHFRAVFH